MPCAGPGARRLACGREGTRSARLQGDPLPLAGGSVWRDASQSHSPRQHASAIARAIGHIRDDSDRRLPSRASRGSRNERVVVPQTLQAITSTTPLQYQKELRLLEARRLLKTVRCLGHRCRLRGRVRELEQQPRVARKFGARRAAIEPRRFLRRPHYLAGGGSRHGRLLRKAGDGVYRRRWI